MSYDNHFSRIIPPLRITNNVTILENNATKGRWFFIVCAMMFLVIKFAFAKNLLFDTLTYDVTKIRVRNFCQTHVNIYSRNCKSGLMTYDRRWRFF